MPTHSCIHTHTHTHTDVHTYPKGIIRDVDPEIIGVEKIFVQPCL